MAADPKDLAATLQKLSDVGWLARSYCDEHTGKFSFKLTPLGRERFDTMLPILNELHGLTKAQMICVVELMLYFQKQGGADDETA